MFVASRQAGEPLLPLLTTAIEGKARAQNDGLWSLAE